MPKKVTFKTVEIKYGFVDSEQDCLYFFVPFYLFLDEKVTKNQGFAKIAGFLRVGFHARCKPRHGKGFRLLVHRLQVPPPKPPLEKLRNLHKASPFLAFARKRLAYCLFQSTSENFSFFVFRFSFSLVILVKKNTRVIGFLVLGGVLVVGLLAHLAAGNGVK